MLLLIAPRQAVLGWLVLSAGVGGAYLFFYLDAPDTSSASANRQSIEPNPIADSTDSISMESQPSHAISAIAIARSSSRDTPATMATQALPSVSGWPSGGSIPTVDAILAAEFLPEDIPKSAPNELKSLTAATAWTPNSSLIRPKATDIGDSVQVAASPLEPIILNSGIASPIQKPVQWADNNSTSEPIAWPDKTFGASKPLSPIHAINPSRPINSNLSSKQIQVTTPIQQPTTPRLSVPSTLRPIQARPASE